MKCSNRICTMQYSPIRNLSSYVNIPKKNGVKIYHLNIGQPDIKTPHTFFDEIKKFNKEVLEYSSSSGISSLINSIIDYYKLYDIVFEEDEILITAGASEGLLFSILATCDSNDNILIPEPFYTNYNGFSQALNVDIIPITTKIETGFHLPSIENITSLINSNTKAILICNPGNPTGCIYSKDEIYMLAKIAYEYDLWIIADEVYREFIYDNLEYISFGTIDKIKDRTILIDSISKKYSACGARIGSIACKNKYLIQEILKLCQNRLSVSTLEQLGACSLYKYPFSYFNKISKEYESRRDLLYNELIKIDGIVCKKPSGAFYILAKLPINDAKDFAKWLITDFNLNNETVMICPAKDFYKSSNLGKDEIRLSYVLKEEDLIKSINIIKEGLKIYIQTKNEK